MEQKKYEKHPGRAFLMQKLTMLRAQASATQRLLEVLMEELVELGFDKKNPKFFELLGHHQDALGDVEFALSGVMGRRGDSSEKIVAAMGAISKAFEEQKWPLELGRQNGESSPDWEPQNLPAETFCRSPLDLIASGEAPTGRSRKAPAFID